MEFESCRLAAWRGLDKSLRILIFVVGDLVVSIAKFLLCKKKNLWYFKSSCKCWVSCCDVMVREWTTHWYLPRLSLS